MPHPIFGHSRKELAAALEVSVGTVSGWRRLGLPAGASPDEARAWLAANPGATFSAAYRPGGPLILRRALQTPANTRPLVLSRIQTQNTPELEANP